jgi:methionyl-tRNA formyltransferase
MGLRIALFGQAAFARDCLDRLIQDHEIVGVFAPPAGARPDPLATRAEELGLPLVRRRYFRKKNGEAIATAVEEHRALGADLNVLAFVNVFVPREILDAPAQKSLCFHPSLLPRYRGGAALSWQIILGETESGVSVFVPDEGADTGPVVLQLGGVRIEPHETMGTLYFEKLYPLGLDAIAQAVRQIETGTARPWEQDEAQASHQGLVDDAVAAIDLARPAAEVDCLVRGCDPQPGAFVSWKGQRVRLFDARLERGNDSPPGTVSSVDASGLVLALNGGALRVGRVRADAAKEAAHEFAQRAGLAPGQRFESA